MKTKTKTSSRIAGWTRTVFIKQRNDGFWPTLVELARFLTPMRYDIYELDLVSFRETLRECSANFSSGDTALQELQSVRPKTRLPAEFYKDLTGKPCGCVLASFDGNVMGVAWLYDHTAPGPFLELSPGDVVVRSLYVLERSRGRGIARAMILQACLWCRRAGFRNMYAVVRQNNLPSEATFKNVGFKRVGRLLRSTVFGPRCISPTREHVEVPSETVW